MITAQHFSEFNFCSQAVNKLLRCFQFSQNLSQANRFDILFRWNMSQNLDSASPYLYDKVRVESLIQNKVKATENFFYKWFSSSFTETSFFS